MSEVKSNLAKLLATENISVRKVAGAKTASFDTKNRILRLPVWKHASEHVGDMLIVHEVGHALFTPQTWLDDARDICPPNVKVQVMKSILNIIEDARIDKLQRRRYPGSRINYFYGYQELIKEKFLGEPKKFNERNFLDRMNIYFKGGSFDNLVSFNNDEERAMIARAEALETWSDVLALAKDAYKYCEKEINNEIEEDEDGTGGESQESGEEYTEGDESATSNQSDENSEGESSEDKSPDDKEGKSSKSDDKQKAPSDKSAKNKAKGSDEAEGNSKGKKEASKFDKSNKPDQSGEPKGQNASTGEGRKTVTVETYEIWNEAQENITSKAGSDTPIYATIPKVINQDKCIIDYKYALTRMNLTQKSSYQYLQAYEVFKASIKGLLGSMIKEFEMRKAAENMKRSSVSKTGVLDTGRLQSYKFSEDIFKRLEVVTDGKNHGFAILLDWSASMSNMLKDTIEQLIILTMFCRRIGVPFEVYIFRNGAFGNVISSQFFCAQDKNADGYISAGGMNFNTSTGQYQTAAKLINVLSSRMKKQEFEMACQFLFENGRRSANVSADFTLTGTPLAEALILFEHAVGTFRKKNSVDIMNVFVITDGDGNGVNLAPWTATYSSYTNSSRPGIIQDLQTKKEYAINQFQGTFFRSNERYKSFMGVMIEVIRDRYDANVIGLYLFPMSQRNIEFGSKQSFFLPDQGVKNKKKTEPVEYKSLALNRGYIKMNAQGFDDYYLICVFSDRTAYDWKEKNVSIRKNELGLDELDTESMAQAVLRSTNEDRARKSMFNQIVSRIAS